MEKDAVIYQYESTIHVQVTNLDEFKRLINKAEEQANQLQKTICTLRSFSLDFQFSIREPEVER